MIKLVAVEPRQGYELLLAFSDGTSGVYDFAPFVDAGTEMTAPLADPTFFARHFIELGALAWPNGFDLSGASLQAKCSRRGRWRSLIASPLRERTGSLPLIVTNTFLPKEHAGEVATKLKLMRSTETEKREQIAGVHAFQPACNPIAPSGETDHTSEVDSTGESPSVRAERSPKGVVEVQQKREGHGSTCRTPPATARTH